METKSLSSFRSKLFVSSALGVVLLAAAIFAVRQELLHAIVNQRAQQEEATERLNRKLSTIEAQLTELAASPKPDPAALEAAKAALTDTQTSLAQINERLVALEKHPVTVAPQAAPAANPAQAVTTAPATLEALERAVKSGAPYTAELDAWQKSHRAGEDATKLLRLNAAGGVMSEASLREQLGTLIAQATNEPASDGSLASRLNMHLAGLIVIKKQSTASKALLAMRTAQASAPIETLASAVAQLPANEQASFVAWASAVHDRSAVLRELAALSAWDVQP